MASCSPVCYRTGGMAKRIADKELTDRNWDQEEEGEEVSPQNRAVMSPLADT